MKITKYIHSCLLLEKEGQQLLFDPGKFSFIEGLVKPEVFDQVSYILITHDHPDHLDIAALRQIIQFSGARVYSTQEVAHKLGPESFVVEVVEEGTFLLGPFEVQAISVPHEPVLDDHLPQMFAFLIDGRVLNPADSFSPKLLAFAGVELLILPVMAPFLTELVVVNFACKLRPRQILPVHDGYAKPFFLQQRYETYKPYFDQEGIQFRPLQEPGQFIIL